MKDEILSIFIQNHKLYLFKPDDFQPTPAML